MSGDAEIIDKVRGINNDYFTMIEQMRKSTDYLQYRKFIHRFVSDIDNSAMLLTLIRAAEKELRPLHSDPDFWEFMNAIVDEEYLKKKGSFVDERIKVGFMGG